MKKINYILAFILFVNITFSQTASSIANGNWLNPLTWNCTCIPTNSYNVTINHNVTLNTSMLFSSGGLTVNPGASMIQDASLNRDLMFSGGNFVNNGTSNFRNLLMTAGNSSNSGSLTLVAFTNSLIPFVNSGTIQMDSMLVAGSFTNTNIGKINGDSILNTSTFLNNGNMNVKWGTNASTFNNSNYYTGYAYTNSGNYENNDSIILTYSFWNKNNFNNKNGAVLNLTKSFNNKNLLGTATFTNNGKVKILDSWFNSDTIKGTSGSFIISDSTVNTGFLKGSFDFCDLTQTVSTAPFIDINTGTVSSLITWCAATSLNSKEQIDKLEVFPNPASNYINVENLKNCTIINVIDVNGKSIKKVDVLTSENDIRVNLNLIDGIYFIKFLNSSGQQINSKKLIIKN